MYFWLGPSYGIRTTTKFAAVIKELEGDLARTVRRLFILGFAESLFRFSISFYVA